ncbi:MAG: transcriptional regulator [Archaeoglobus sp.]|nr:transcriptional regulator [Archaeoglobus sp.]
MNLTKNQAKILGYLSQKSVRFSDLVKNLGLARATISTNLKKLIEAGLIERKVDSTTSEYPPPVYYSITPKGREIIKKYSKNIKAGIEEDAVKIEFDDAISSAILEGTAASIDYKNLNEFLRDLIEGYFLWIELTEDDTPDKYLVLLKNLSPKSSLQTLKWVHTAKKSIEKLEQDYTRIQDKIKDPEEASKLNEIKKDIERIKKELDEFLNYLRFLHEINEKEE